MVTAIFGSIDVIQSSYNVVQQFARIACAQISYEILFIVTPALPFAESFVECVCCFNGSNLMKSHVIWNRNWLFIVKQTFDTKVKCRIVVRYGCWGCCHGESFLLFSPLVSPFAACRMPSINNNINMCSKDTKLFDASFSLFFSPHTFFTLLRPLHL